MAKKPVAILVFVLLFLPAWAEAEAPARLRGNWGTGAASDAPVRLGGRLGVNLATLSRERPSTFGVENSHKLGAAGGLYGTVTLGTGMVDVALQAEMLVSAKGANLEIEGEYIGDYRLMYLDIPLLARISLPLGGRWSPYGVVGPSFSILLNASQDESDGRRRDINDVIISYDIGLVFGLGASWEPPFSGRMSLELRYDFGFLLIDRIVPGESFFKNRTVSFMIGYSPDLFRRGARASQVRHIEPAGDLESAEPEEVEPDLADEAPSFGPSEDVSADQQDLRRQHR